MTFHEDTSALIFRFREKIEKYRRYEWNAC